MISIAPSDRDVLRFLWFQEPAKLESKILHFRFTRVVFGLKPSPAILGTVILQHLIKYQSEYPTVVEQISNGLYVDDLITGADNIESAFKLYTISKRVMKDAGMNLRKFNTNSPELLHQIEEIEGQSGVDQPEDSKITEEEQSYARLSTGSVNYMSGENHIKLLGVLWDRHSDSLYFNFSELLHYTKSLPMTKRSVLKITAKLFDPLGLLSPFVIRLKILFKCLCTVKVNWDESLQGEVLTKWKSIVNEMESLNYVKVPRCYFKKCSRPVEFQLHGFSDASAEAYGAVVYLRTTYEDGSISVNLVASKTRVSPIKTQAISRLELLAALILTRLVSTIKKSLKLSQEVNTFYWTDSTVVLYWISKPRQWKQYVSHRVSEIRRHSSPDDWNHCPGVLNPADMPSRGLRGCQIEGNEVWWRGPSFLELHPSEWPHMEIQDTDSEAQLELMKNDFVISHTLSVATSTLTFHKVQNIIDCTCFSKLDKLLKVTAYVLRFVHNLKNQRASQSLHSDNIQKFKDMPSINEITEATSGSHLYKPVSFFQKRNF